MTREAGSSTAESALVMVLLTVLALGLLQLAVVGHVRTVLVDDASVAARLAATGDRAAAAARARALITADLAADYAQDVQVTDGMLEGLAVSAVRVRAPLPLLGPWWGPARALEVTGHALRT